MERFLSRLLKRYDSADQELRLKAKFILISTMTMIAALTIMMVFTTLIGGFHTIIFVLEGTAYVVLATALAALVRGRYSLAVHIILATGFLITWLIMFNDPMESLIVRLDSIVFIVGILAAMPLFLFRDRRPMVVYFIANLSLLLVFILFLYRTTDLTILELVDYAMDNTVVICFVFAVSASIFSINRQVMAAMKKELTERQKAESNLENMRILLSNTINAMPSVMVGVNQALKIIIWNEAAPEFTEIPEDRAEGQALFDLLTPLEPYRETIQNVIHRQIVSRKFKIPLDFPGQEPIMDMTIFPIPGIRGAVIRLDDISQRLRMEELVIQSEKMLSLGGLAAGMAHEINNPLAGMIQTTQLIENRIGPGGPANIKTASDLGMSMEQICNYLTRRDIPRLVSNIREAGLRAAKIVESMLDFARDSHGEKSLHDPVELTEETIVLAQNEYDLKKRYDFKNITIKKEFQPNLPQLLCDKGKLQQVIFNILKNGSQAMMSRDTPTDPPCITLRLYGDHERICVEIEDNGPGMPPEICKRVFDPFFTTKAQGQGTGLGLSVSYFIVTEDHGGTLTVDSEPGKGTRFTICLPQTGSRCTLTP